MLHSALILLEVLYSYFLLRLRRFWWTRKNGLVWPLGGSRSSITILDQTVNNGRKIRRKINHKKISIRDPAWPYYTSSTIAINTTTREKQRMEQHLEIKSGFKDESLKLCFAQCAAAPGVSLRRHAGRSQPSTREHRVSPRQSDKLPLLSHHVRSANQRPTAKKLNIPSPCWTVALVVPSVTEPPLQMKTQASSHHL